MNKKSNIFLKGTDLDQWYMSDFNTGKTIKLPKGAVPFCAFIGEPEKYKVKNFFLKEQKTCKKQ